MRKSILYYGLKLLLISIVFRIISFAFFSISWQWSSVFIRAIEILLGVVYLGIWLIYGIRMKARLKNGLIIGLIGTSDAVLLMVLSLVLYVNRNSYYFGPVEMVVWNIPLLGIINLRFLSNVILYAAPFFAILLTAIGSFIRKDDYYCIHAKVNKS